MHAPQTPSPRELEFTGTVFFISDLHLTPHMPRTAAAFVHFLRHTAPQTQALFILGDLFEYWIGDDVLQAPDDAGQFSRDMLAALRSLGEQGVAVYWLVGNRDFLLGDHAARTAGVTALPDPCVISVQGQRVLLSHGDAYCTADTGYQRMRWWFRQGWLQKAFLSLPRTWRLGVARYLRGNSQAQHYSPSQLPSWMDVTPTAIETALSSAQAPCLIHGHTHRPGCTAHTQGKRWVLSDWDFDGSTPRGSALRWQAEQAEPAYLALQAAP